MFVVHLMPDCSEYSLTKLRGYGEDIGAIKASDGMIL